MMRRKKRRKKNIIGDILLHKYEWSSEHAENEDFAVARCEIVCYGRMVTISDSFCMGNLRNLMSMRSSSCEHGSVSCESGIKMISRGTNKLHSLRSGMAAKVPAQKACKQQRGSMDSKRKGC